MNNKNLINDNKNFVDENFFTDEDDNEYYENDEENRIINFDEIYFSDLSIKT
jgi:hypothetical protein